MIKYDDHRKRHLYHKYGILRILFPINSSDLKKVRIQCNFSKVINSYYAFELGGFHNLRKQVREGGVYQMSTEVNKFQ